MQDEEFEMTGTVETAVSLAGPHATMKVRAQGQVWDITLAPPARTERAGLTEKTIPVGAQVTVHGHRNRDPKRFEVKTERVDVERQDVQRRTPGPQLAHGRPRVVVNALLAWIESSALGSAMRALRGVDLRRA